MPRRTLTHPLALERLADAQRGESVDVLGAAIALATHANPGLKPRVIHEQLETMARDVRHLVNFENPLHRAIGHVLFTRYGFLGNTAHHAGPENSYVDQVMRTRTGLPILLSLVYVETARRAGAAAYGIGLPGHFVAAIDVPGGAAGEGGAGGKRVYVDAFNRGAEWTEAECRQAAQASGVPWSEAYLEPMEPRAWVVRMLMNLKHAHLQRRDRAGMAAVLEQLVLMEPSNQRRREELETLYRAVEEDRAQNN